jgi:hypothetical protein
MANAVAYGFVGLQHLFSQQITDQNVPLVLDAVRQSAEFWTNQMNTLFGAANLAERTTEHKARYALTAGGTLQPLDEWGNPLPVREEGYYELAWPIQGGGTAFGDNRVTRALMTVEDANRRTLELIRRDADWVRRHILAAIFDNTTWSYTDQRYGALTIQPLANGDTVTYPRKNGTVSTDTHFLAQAGAIADVTNPFPAIYTELNEHPGNTGPFVVYVPSNVVSAVQALTAFVPVADSDIRLGNASDTLVGTVDAGVGEQVLGKVDNLWIIEWGALPNDYLIGHARGGNPPVRMREYPAASLQGLITEFHSSDGNLRETRMIRYAGFGAFDRTSALVQRVGNGAYAIPTGYTQPLPV